MVKTRSTSNVVKNRSSSNVVNTRLSSNILKDITNNNRSCSRVVSKKRKYIKDKIANKYFNMVQKLVKRSEIYGLRSSLIEETQILYPWYTPGHLKYTVDKLSASSREREMVTINALLDIASNKTINKRNEPNILRTAAHKYALE